MMQFFSKPDGYAALCGDLRCSVAEHRICHAPDFMKGLRALFVTDIHVLPGTTDADMEALADRMAALKPDILMLGGDYADTAPQTRRFLQHLGRLSVPMGIYSAVGNNDREAFLNLQELRRLMSATGIELLVNESRTLRMGQGRLIVAGLDEYRYGSPDARGLYPDAPRENRNRILISHYPRIVDPMPDLMLCGHTHGGQFNCLGVTPYTIGFERIIRRCRAPRYISGMHTHDGATILTSKGIGASRVPVRIGVRPEIDLITFE